MKVLPTRRQEVSFMRGIRVGKFPGRRVSCVN
jgi:hypothetical protein